MLAITLIRAYLMRMDIQQLSCYMAISNDHSTETLATASSQGFVRFGEMTVLARLIVDCGADQSSWMRA